MSHLEQLALDAQLAVHVLSNSDASEIELLDLKPRTASDSEIQSLKARWPGRGLRSIGVIGRMADGCVAMALKGPIDHIQLAALLLAFTQHCEAAEPRADESVTWCERLYSLPDTRPN